MKNSLQSVESSSAVKGSLISRILSYIDGLPLVLVGFYISDPGWVIFGLVIFLIGWITRYLAYKKDPRQSRMIYLSILAALVFLVYLFMTAAYPSGVLTLQLLAGFGIFSLLWCISVDLYKRFKSQKD